MIRLKNSKYLVNVNIFFIQFNIKKGIMLDPCTNLAVQGQHDSGIGRLLTTEEMIVSHHYYVSINKEQRKEEKF